MSDNEGESKKDDRMVCRFGVKCYQKNPVHHAKYKHPPKRPLKGLATPLPKKVKRDDDAPIVEAKVENDSNRVNIGEKSDTDKPMGGKNKIESISDSDDESQPKTKKAESISDSDDDMFPDADAFAEIIKQVDINKIDENQSTSNNPPIMLSNHFNVKEFIKNKFLVDMPKDFYQFWDFCKTRKPTNPLEALKEIGLTLVGPFEVLAGKFYNIQDKSDEEYLLHWRYYYDPPEFQTVLKGDDQTGYHIGYFRDDPCEELTFMASNSAKNDGVFEIMGDNIFASISLYLDVLKRTADPFKKMQGTKYSSIIKKEADDSNYNLVRKTSILFNRDKKIVTKTFNKIGLVVPYDKKTQIGYRELALDDKTIKIILTKLQNNALPEIRDKLISDLQPALTYATIAQDECDFGTGLEIGLNIFAFGVDSLNSTTQTFLVTSYNLLNRNAFAKIAAAHLNNRKKGTRLSILY